MKKTKLMDNQAEMEAIVSYKVATGKMITQYHNEQKKYEETGDMKWLVASTGTLNLFLKTVAERNK